MAASAPSEARDQRLGRRVVALFAPYRARLLLIALAILVTAGLGIVNPFLTQAVFDRALFAPGGPRLDLLGLLVGAMIVIALVSSLIGVGQTYLTTVLGNRVMQELRDRLFAHLQRMHLGFFTSTKTGVIQSRLDNDVAGVQSVVTETASSILGNVVTVVASVVAMLVLSWQLSLVAFVLMPVFILLQIRVGRVRRRVAASTQVSLSDMSAITQESLSVSGILLAKVFGRQEHEIESYRSESARQTGLQVRQTKTGQSFFAVVQAFFAITPAAVYLVAGSSAPERAGRCSRQAPSSRSRRCRAGCSSPPSSCCGSRSTCRPRSRCSTGSSPTSTWCLPSPTRPDRGPWTRSTPGAPSSSTTCGSTTRRPRRTRSSRC